MTAMPPRLLIGSDTGGTFTDFVRLDETGLRTWKIASTPDDFARAVLDGVGRLLAESPSRPSAVELVHSTTVATNALLERKGARVALLTLISPSTAKERIRNRCVLPGFRTWPTGCSWTSDRRRTSRRSS